MYLDQQRVGNEDRRFEDAVEQEIQQIESGDLPDDIRRRYVWCGRYATHVNNWKKAFGDDHMRAFLTDDLRWPVKVWSDLSGFLCYDLGEERLAQLSIRERNVAGELRWPHVVRALRRLEGRDSKVIRRIQRWLPPGWDRRVAQGIFNRNQVTKARPVPIPPDFTMRLLDKYYLPDVAELEEILNRPLTAWRPENIGRR